MTKRTHVLTQSQKTDLEASINSFKSWLRKSKGLRLDAATRYEKLCFPRPISGDWIMQVKGPEVQFNTYVIDRCSFEYFSASCSARMLSPFRSSRTEQISCKANKR
jgi:hypothetical protein